MDGMLNKKDELLTRIEFHKPHIIGLTEIRPKNCLHPPIDTEYEIKGCDMFLNGNPKRGALLLGAS